ncbi:MAG: hypothetical protein E5X98_06450 [Mesorhizobium sp.]|nr:MAG: hypothetical protein E5X98_06450 [Mesorhizobium sp.]
MHFLSGFFGRVIVANVGAPSRPPLPCRASPPQEGRSAVARAFANRNTSQQYKSPPLDRLPACQTKRATCLPPFPYSLWDRTS